MQGRNLPCPVCETPIAIAAGAVLRGDKIACTKCGTSLALQAGEGARETLAQFELAKREIREAGSRIKKAG